VPVRSVTLPEPITPRRNGYAELATFHRRVDCVSILGTFNSAQRSPSRHSRIHARSTEPTRHSRSVRKAMAMLLSGIDSETLASIPTNASGKDRPVHSSRNGRSQAAGHKRELYSTAPAQDTPTYGHSGSAARRAASVGLPVRQSAGYAVPVPIHGSTSSSYAAAYRANALAGRQGTDPYLLSAQGLYGRRALGPREVQDGPKDVFRSSCGRPLASVTGVHVAAGRPLSAAAARASYLGLQNAVPAVKGAPFQTRHGMALFPSAMVAIR
jgi:hypothetical protein